MRTATGHPSTAFDGPSDREPDSMIAVGGLAARIAAVERQDRRPELAAVGKAVDLRRRERGLTPETLAEQARVTVEMLFDLERGVVMPNSPSVIRLVSRVLDLPADKLIAAGSLSPVAAPDLQTAAMRFVRHAQAPEQLSPREREALTAFIGALAEQ